MEQGITKVYYLILKKINNNSIPGPLNVTLENTALFRMIV